MKSFFICIILIITIQSCSYDKTGTTTVSKDSIPPTTEVMEQYEVAMDTIKTEASFHIYTLTTYESAPYTSTITSETSTRFKFKNFHVVFHKFVSPMIDNHNNGSGIPEPRGDEEFKLISSDTAFLSEDLDERINNTLIEIIPTDKNDKFLISMGYITSLNEILNEQYYTKEEIELFSNNWKPIKEKTKFIPIKDSANYLFRALPHTSDMETVTITDGQVLPIKKRNSEEEINYEKRLSDEELNRIKSKYQLKDTHVVIPGEYAITATLTKNKKLYNYDYDAFLFRIDRFRHKKLKESKYVLVWISYGC